MSRHRRWRSWLQGYGLPTDPLDDEDFDKGNPLKAFLAAGESAVLGTFAGAGAYVSDKVGADELAASLGDYKRRTTERRQREMERSLASNPNSLLNVGANLTGQFVAEMLPLVPGGPLGKIAGKTLGLTSKGAKMAGYVGSGLLEGALTGASASYDTEDRGLGSVALSALAGAGMGAYSGRSAAKALAAKGGGKGAKALDSLDKGARRVLDVKAKKREMELNNWLDNVDPEIAKEFPADVRRIRVNLGAAESEDEVLEFLVESAPSLRAMTGAKPLERNPAQYSLKKGFTPDNIAEKLAAKETVDDPDMASLNLFIGTAGKRVRAGKESGDLKGIEKDAEILGSLIATRLKYAGAAGRSLNSLRWQVEGLGDGDLTRIALAQKLSIQDNPNALKRLAMIDIEDPDAVYSLMREVRPNSWKTLFMSSWYGSILSAVGTQIRNISGGLGALAAEFGPTRSIAGALDSFTGPNAVKGMEGLERSIYTNEFMPAVKAGGKAMWEAVRRNPESKKLDSEFWFYLRKGYRKSDPYGRAKLDVDMDALKGIDIFDAMRSVAGGEVDGLRRVDALATVFKMPIRFLGAVDSVVKSTAFAGDMAAMVRRGEQKGLTPGLRERTALAKQTELKTTFQDESSPLGKAAAGVQRLGIPGRMIFPFVKVSDRLLNMGFDYSPAGLLRKGRGFSLRENVFVGVKETKRELQQVLDKIAVATAKGEDVKVLEGKLLKISEKRSEQMEQLGRVFTGTTLMGMTAAAYSQGIITGDAPSDLAEREEFYRRGKQPFSVEIAGKSIPFAQLEPVSVPLTALAAFMDSYGRGKEGQKTADASLGAIRALTDRSYLAGLRDLFDVLSRRPGTGNPLKAIGRQATGAIPYSSMLGSVARFVDPQVRESTGLGGEFLKKIPGLSSTLPGRVDMFGDPIIPGGGESALRPFLPTGTPFTTTSRKESPVDDALRAADIRFGGSSRTSVDMGRGEVRDLTDSEKLELKVATGQAVKAEILRVSGSAGFDKQSQERQNYVLQKVIDRARENVWRRFRGGLMRAS